MVESIATLAPAVQRPPHGDGLRPQVLPGRRRRPELGNEPAVDGIKLATVGRGIAASNCRCRRDCPLRDAQSATSGRGFMDGAASTTMIAPCPAIESHHPTILRWPSCAPAWPSRAVEMDRTGRWPARAVAAVRRVRRVRVVSRSGVGRAGVERRASRARVSGAQRGLSDDDVCHHAADRRVPAD